MQDEKNISRIKKLQALAERGVGGEKQTAMIKLEKMLKKCGVNSLEEIMEEKQELFVFGYHEKYEEKLLHQCIFKTVGKKMAIYRIPGRRKKVGVYCTPAQKIEIDLDFEFYSNLFRKEIDVFLVAFIQAQELFPDNCPVTQSSSLEDLRMLEIAANIKKETRQCLLESF